MHPHLNIALRAARLAGDIILQGLNRLDSIEFREKRHNDFVSNIDLQAEEAILETLRASFPEDSFLTEEQGELWGANPDTIWVIDALDGTLNFMHGFPFFAVSIAKKVNGRVEQALIFNPVSQDVFSASRGEGASLNDRRIRVAKRSQLPGSLIAVNMPRAAQTGDLYHNIITKILPNIGALRRTGSSALDLAFVASGQLDGFICDHFSEWDIAAGLLLIREAGGMITDFKGGDAILEQQQLLAANPKLLKPLLLGVG
jgi:myo-inositol-1(or 4)-monophosphatase